MTETTPVFLFVCGLAVVATVVVTWLESRGPRRGWKDCSACKGGRMHDRGMASECDRCGEVTSP